MKVKVAACLDLDRHVGEHERDRLLCDEWLVERLAHLCVRERLLECGARHADGAGRDAGAGLVEGLHDDVEALPLLADAVLGRDDHVLEQDLGGVR